MYSARRLSLLFIYISKYSFYDLLTLKLGIKFIRQVNIVIFEKNCQQRGKNLISQLIPSAFAYINENYYLHKKYNIIIVASLE